MNMHCENLQLRPAWCRQRALLAAVGALCCLGVTGTSFAQTETLNELIARCAPTVHPETMMAIVGVESRGHQFAIADAGPVRLPWSQRKSMVRSYYMGSVEEAVAKAKGLIQAGHTVSLGLAQVNDRNLAKLGLSLDTVFDPCTNVSAGGKIMTNFYERAAAKFGPGERALRAALSAYNSGDWLRGERDGYVGMVYRQAGRPLAIKTSVRVPKIRPGGDGGVSVVNAGTSKREFTLSSTDFQIQY